MVEEGKRTQMTYDRLCEKSRVATEYPQIVQNGPQGLAVSEWPLQMLKDYLRHNIKLICSACRADGFTTYDTDGRTCKFCKKKRGAGKFDKLFVS